MPKKISRKSLMNVLNMLADIDAQIEAQAKVLTSRYSTASQLVAARAARDTLSLQRDELAVAINRRGNRYA